LSNFREAQLGQPGIEGQYSGHLFPDFEQPRYIPLLRPYTDNGGLLLIQFIDGSANLLRLGSCRRQFSAESVQYSLLSPILVGAGNDRQK
jgi:hypothetical protein